MWNILVLVFSVKHPSIIGLVKPKLQRFSRLVIPVGRYLVTIDNPSFWMRIISSGETAFHNFCASLRHKGVMDE